MSAPASRPLGQRPLGQRPLGQRPLGQRLGDLVPGRECGACDLCCILPDIDDPALKKPPGQPCPHLIRHQGCAIYESRPGGCRRWYCVWRQMAQLPDSCRPDRLGVMLSFVAEPESPLPERLVYFLGQAAEDESAYRSPLAQGVFGLLIQVAPLWLVVGETMVEYGGPGKAPNPFFQDPGA